MQTQKGELKRLKTSLGWYTKTLILLSIDVARGSRIAYAVSVVVIK